MSDEQAVSTDQVAPGVVDDRTSESAAPWREVHSALRRAHHASWTLFAFLLATMCVELFWPLETKGQFSIRTSVMLGLIAAQLSAALMHVVAQFRCASPAVGEGRLAANRSAWAGVGFVSIALLGGLLPGGKGVYAIYIAFFLIIVSTFFWQVFLRALAERLEIRDLRTRINRLVWWTCLAAACMLYRTVALDRAPPFVGTLSGIVLLVCVGVYARLISATAARVAERTLVE